MNLREFFYFNKSDRKVLLFLLMIAAVVVAVHIMLGQGDEMTVVTAEDSLAVEDNSRRNGEYDGHGRGEAYHRYGGRSTHMTYRQDERTAEAFSFDPNTADSTALLRLGLTPGQVRSIYRYRAKGGVFRRPEDFARLYSLTKGQYDRLRPYIRIGEDYQEAALFVEKEKPNRDTLRYPVKIEPNEHIVLNTADTTQLKKVPGIGSGWAKRIMSYGERLGGYVDVMQLTEMEGFPPEALGYFVVENPQTRKMNINKLTLNQLRQHPYINFYQAREITDYRRLKGNLQSLEQLRLLKDFTPEAINRLTPYVEF